MQIPRSREDAPQGDPDQRILVGPWRLWGRADDNHDDIGDGDDDHGDDHDDRGDCDDEDHEDGDDNHDDIGDGDDDHDDDHDDSGDGDDDHNDSDDHHKLLVSVTTFFLLHVGFSYTLIW